MPKLVSQWRKIWAANSGTDPNAPFGLVTLAASGSEGGADIGSMRCKPMLSGVCVYLIICCVLWGWG